MWCEKLFPLALANGTRGIGRWGCTPEGLLETGKDGSADGEADSEALAESDGDADSARQATNMDDTGAWWRQTGGPFVRQSGTENTPHFAVPSLRWTVG